MARKTTPGPTAIKRLRKYAESPHERGGFRDALSLLPSGDEALLSHASMRLDQFNDAMACGDSEAIAAAELFYWAAVYRLNGDTVWACKLGGGGLDRVQRHLAPAMGVPTRWGECGEWLLEVGDMRMRVRVGCGALGGSHGVRLYAVDAQALFLNEHGEHDLQLWPYEFQGLDFVRALRQEVERLLGGECVPVALNDHSRASVEQPAWMAPAMESVTRNGQQSLPLSGRPVAELVEPESEPKAPMTNADRQRLFRKRQKERAVKAQAEGVLTVQLSDRDRSYLTSALDYYEFQEHGEYPKRNLLELYRRLQPSKEVKAWPDDEKRAAWYSRQVWHNICDSSKRKQEKAEAELAAARAEIQRLHAELATIAAELSGQPITTNQQIDKSTFSEALQTEAFSLQLLRRHKWKGGNVEDVALVAVQVVPHEGQWMWAACLSSQNGSGYSYAPLPKWGKFAATPGAALQKGLAEAREHSARMTPAERKQFDAWLAGEVAERLAQLGAADGEKINNSTNQQMLMI